MSDTAGTVRPRATRPADLRPVDLRQAGPVGQSVHNRHEEDAPLALTSVTPWVGGG